MFLKNLIIEKFLNYSYNFFYVLNDDWIKKVDDLDEIRSAQKIPSEGFALKFPETEKYLGKIINYNR